MSLAHWLIVAVALQRMAEVAYARHNEARLRLAGAVEAGAGHYPLLVALHAGWLTALWFAVDDETPLLWPLLVAFGLLQLARLWTIRSLGRFWTTRVLTLPGAPMIGAGPYRFCRHPNYAVVAAEIAVLPLAFGAWRIALVFTLANAALLWWRIRIEARALAPRRRAGGGAQG